MTFYSYRLHKFSCKELNHLFTKEIRYIDRMSKLVPKKPKYHVLDNGYIIPLSFAKEFENSLTFVPDPGDIFICTYPKCGTTWTQCILQLLRNKGEPLKPGENINAFIPHLEEEGKDVVVALPKPRVIKTHVPYNMLPKHKDAKYILVARNPKDCGVSYFYHTKGFERCYDFVDGKFDDYFQLFLSGEVDYGDYFHHLLSYLPHKDEPNFLFLLYEEMQADVQSCVVKIGNFLGGAFLETIKDPVALKKVIENSGFKIMKSNPSSWSTQQAEGSAGFIRKGKVGDWRTHFTEEQSQLMDEKFKDKLTGTVAEHFWDEFDC